MEGQTAGGPGAGTPTFAVRAHEELFAYWATRRRRRGHLPARRHIHPADFKRHLPSISLINVIRDEDGRLDYRMRLAGTGLYGVYGQEITGKSLEEAYGGAADYWRAELDKVVASRKPGAGVHSLAWRGLGHMSVVWLRLPLASNGREVDMILGYDGLIGLRENVETRTGIRPS
ncbi:MAG: PAS domain-containing protein [Pseudomonadota bacterium]|nr:PAS domain-containing protein [Pseudomonadota bacterium]